MSASTSTAALADMRRTRQRRTLGDQEWFDIAYRVYLVALAGGAAVLTASDRVHDAVVTASTIADIEHHGPAVLGLGAATAFAAGLRSGANGGPVALEAPDVRYLLLAPVPRRTMLRRPVVQRIRSLAAPGALVGGVAGILAAQRLPGSAAAWAAAGAIAGGCTLALFGAVAVLAHVLRVTRPLATTIAVAVIGAQAVAAVTDLPGPADTFGSLALWGMRQRAVDVVAVAVTAVLVTFAISRCGSLRPEPLQRRADLVSQLRFAVTMQDLRTVVLLRRQLRNETTRARPWPLPFGRRPSSRRALGSIVRQRGWRSLARLPLARVARTAGFALAAGFCAVAALRGTTPALLGVGVALFLMALELLEPTSQEVDHPDLSGMSRAEPDAVLLHSLAAPAIAIVPFALVAAGVVAALEPVATLTALALAVPSAWMGACGAAISIAGETRSLDSTTGSAMVIPEFAGFATAMRSALPLAVSSLAAIPVLAMREQPTVDTAARCALGLLLGCALCVWWVRRHNEYGARIREFFEAGRRR